jgi:molybdopterin/thiamine biosynthesis adenylyltransferase
MLRYLRNKDLIKQSLLDEITIIGAGGIASALVTILVQMGFKKFHIWDDDKLEEHNLSTTAYPENMLGMHKAECATNMIFKYNNKANITQYVKRWVPGDYLSDIVMLTPDNMETRLDVHMDWKRNDNRRALIDMRMGALTMEVISIEKDNDNFIKTWQSSNKISDEACTAKHTIFTANVVAGLGASQLFNVLHNRSYWQYIRQSLAPLSFGREYPINKINNEVNNDIKESQKKSGVSKSGNFALVRTTQGRQDNNVKQA